MLVLPRKVNISIDGISLLNWFHRLMETPDMPGRNLTCQYDLISYHSWNRFLYKISKFGRKDISLFKLFVIET